MHPSLSTRYTPLSRNGPATCVDGEARVCMNLLEQYVQKGGGQSEPHPISAMQPPSSLY